MLALLTNAFPIWVLVMALLALWQPQLFTWFSGPWITAGLGIIMLGMGLTLTLDDFKRVAKFPEKVGIGMLLQYTVMPFSGWLMSYVFQLPAPFAVGLILVACCPGGTASNVVTYLAKADVPLSVTMTAISTIAGVVMTPILTAWLAGSRVDVNAMGLLINTFQVVVAPVIAGILLNRYAHRLTGKILPAAPLVAVLLIAMIVASIMGAGRDVILSSGFQLVGAVFTLHAMGFFWGYVFSRFARCNETEARTISIEVGMQNSGLGAVLARKNFSDPSTAIPSAISSLMHSLIGSLCAAVWRLNSQETRKKQNAEGSKPV